MKSVALIDDHEVVSIAVQAAVEQVGEVDYLGAAATVPDLLNRFPSVDIAILDLRLADGSSPIANVHRLQEAGVETLVFTSGESPYLMRSVAKTQILGVVRKSAPMDVLIDALRTAAAGKTVMSAEWASSIDSDPRLDSAGLSKQELQVLELLARGLKSQAVAYELGIATPTVDDYIRRIRGKYQRVGRPAHNKIDLYRRAVEDGIIPPPTP